MAVAERTIRCSSAFLLSVCCLVHLTGKVWGTTSTTDERSPKNTSESLHHHHHRELRSSHSKKSSRHHRRPNHNESPSRDFLKYARQNYVACEALKQWKYSAAWFASTALLRAKFAAPRALELDRLSRPGTMMEGASFLVLDVATSYKSLDLLDFYVEHLSWYERRVAAALRAAPRGGDLGGVAAEDKRRVPHDPHLTYPVPQRHHRRKRPTKRDVESNVREPARRAFRARLEEATARVASRTTRDDLASPSPTTVAVMPFYARAAGQGPSSTSMRLSYLNATLASVRAHITPHCAVVVENEDDRATVVNHFGVGGVHNGGHALFDVVYLPGLPDPNKLGVAALVATHRLVAGLDLKKEWLHRFFGMIVDSSSETAAQDAGATHPEKWRDVKYVYYTESDQLARLKSLDAIRAIVDEDPTSRVVLPRRALPLPVSRDFAEMAVRREDDQSAEDDDDARARRGAAAAATKRWLADELRRNDRLGALDLALENATRHADDRGVRVSQCCFAGTRRDACKQFGLETLDDFATAKRHLLRRPDGFAVLPGEGNFLKMAFKPCDFRTCDYLSSGTGGCACPTADDAAVR